MIQLFARLKNCICKEIFHYLRGRLDGEMNVLYRALINCILTAKGEIGVEFIEEIGKNKQLTSHSLQEKSE